MTRPDATGESRADLERRVRALAADDGLADSSARLAELARLVERLRGGVPAERPGDCREILDGFRMGRFSEAIPEVPCAESLEALRDYLGDVRDFGAALARGDLSATLRVGGTLAGSLKSLQASLRHLTWQTRAIAEGDLGIRVDFMGDFAVAFNTMVRRLRETQDALNRRNAELEKARAAAVAASQAKSDFLANVSHEIRTPMNIILGFSEVMAAEIRDPRHREFLDAVDASGRLLLKMINDILDLSRVEAGKLTVEPGPADLRAVAREIASLFENRAGGKGVRVRAEVAPSVPPLVTMDAVRLRQVLVNLVGNAVQATDSGEVVVGMTAAPADAETTTLAVTVRDTGPGIPVDERERIFEPFVQRRDRDAAAGGSGLGLAIVRRLVRLMEGEIRVGDAPGGGALFSVLFRNVAAAEGGAASPPAGIGAAPPGIRFRNVRVLVADDVALNRRLLRAMLGGLGVSVVEADGGCAVLDEFRESRYDLALLDLRMPDRDGLAVARELRSHPRTRDVPLVAVTAATRSDEHRDAAALFDQVLVKPVRRRELIDLLLRFLPGRVAPPPGSASDSDDGPARDLDPAARRRLNRLTALLESDLLPRWRRLGDVVVVGEVEAFARRIAALGREYRCDPVRVWGEQLARRADSVDISAIRRSLERFPEVIEALRELLMERDDG